jgi:spore coat polysaccharide biosynthesis protein SpsF
MDIAAFIQARMSSTRFPGKVLAPLGGRPIIARVIDRVAGAVPPDRIVVVTSSENSDDPLAAYVEHLGFTVFRGPLDDVFARFRLCLDQYPCEWFFRISADSPLLNRAVLTAMLPHAAGGAVDLVTNVLRRTFPHGHSAELLNAQSFAAIPAGPLTAAEREHVTQHYYEHPAQFRIVNLETSDAAYGAQNFAVDTLDDLRRLEMLERAGQAEFTPPMFVTGGAA